MSRQKFKDVNFHHNYGRSYVPPFKGNTSCGKTTALMDFSEIEKRIVDRLHEDYSVGPELLGVKRGSFTKNLKARKMRVARIKKAILDKAWKTVQLPHTAKYCQRIKDWTSPDPEFEVLLETDFSGRTHFVFKLDGKYLF